MSAKRPEASSPETQPPQAEPPSSEQASSDVSPSPDEEWVGNKRVKWTSDGGVEFDLRPLKAATAPEDWVSWVYDAELGAWVCTEYGACGNPVSCARCIRRARAAELALYPPVCAEYAQMPIFPDF